MPPHPQYRILNFDTEIPRLQNNYFKKVPFVYTFIKEFEQKFYMTVKESNIFNKSVKKKDWKLLTCFKILKKTPIHNLKASAYEKLGNYKNKQKL